MSPKDKRTNPSILDHLRSVETLRNQDGIVISSLNNRHQPVVLKPLRPGDRRRLAHLLAQIAWRLAKEQATQDVVLSQESRQDQEQ